MNITLTEATIAKLDLQPGDVIVLRITDPSYKPSAEDVAVMRKRLSEQLGDHPVVVLGHGLDLEIWHQPERMSEEEAAKLRTEWMAKHGS